MLSWPVLISNRRLRVSTRFMRIVVDTSRWYESRVATGMAAPTAASRPNPITADRPGLGDAKKTPRPDEQHRDHDQEPQHVHGGAAHVERADSLDRAQQETPDDGTGQAPHAAHDD